MNEVVWCLKNCTTQAIFHFLLFEVLCCVFEACVLCSSVRVATVILAPRFLIGFPRRCAPKIYGLHHSFLRLI